MEFLGVLWGLRLRQTEQELALAFLFMLFFLLGFMPVYRRSVIAMLQQLAFAARGDYTRQL